MLWGVNCDHNFLCSKFEIYDFYFRTYHLKHSARHTKKFKTLQTVSPVTGIMKVS